MALKNLNRQRSYCFQMWKHRLHRLLCGRDARHLKLYTKTSPDATGHHQPSDEVLAIALNTAFICLSDLRTPNRKHHKMRPLQP